MFSLLIHYFVHCLFEVYLFLDFWLIRITFLDFLCEKVVLYFMKKAKVNLVLAYKRNSKKENQLDLNENNALEDGKWQTITVYDRRVFAKGAIYPSLGIGEAFMLSTVKFNE